MIKIYFIDEKDLIHYFTARIDIENNGQNNNIEILSNSDDDSYICFSKHMSNTKGNNLIIQSCKCILDLKIKCISDGKLNIKLSGINVEDSLGNSIPIFINFVNVTANFTKLIHSNKLVSYSNFYQCKVLDVKNEEIINLHFEWIPLKFNFMNDSFLSHLPFTNLNENRNNADNVKYFSKNFNNFNSYPLKFDKEPIPKVSVIIPVFNPGYLLYKCLDSVVNQSLNEIEIICVDDGSTDGSLDILNEYSEKDNRFKILHQENKGAGVARNKAIDESTGEFIIFLDSDDWIENDMCEKLYIHARNSNSDLVIFDAIWHTVDGDKIFKYFSNDEFKHDYKLFTFDYNFFKNRLMIASYGVIWSRFYRSSFIKDNDIKFPKHKIYNDVEFCFKTAILAKNVAYYPKSFYHYIKLGQPSLQTSFREGKDELIWVDVLRGIYNILMDHDLMVDFRIDFINYCIYYSFEKVINIDWNILPFFLNKLKSFFEILNPTSDELNSLHYEKLVWYKSITLTFIPLYEALMVDNLEVFKQKLIEFLLNKYKNDLKDASPENKEEFYQFLRKKFINFDLSSKLFNNISTELYDFYISVLNFETYYNFNLFNEKDSIEIYKIIDLLWYDVHNSKDVEDYRIFNNKCGTLKIINDYKQLEIHTNDPSVVRVLSQSILGDFEIIFEIKVTDYANVGISSSDIITDFAYLRISNNDWLYYRFIRINGIVSAFVSEDSFNWKTIELTGNTLNSNECQFQFNSGYSNRLNKKTMIRNIKIYRIARG